MAERRTLKIYKGCFDGTTDWLVAARNQKEAAELFGVSVYLMRTYGYGPEDPGADDAFAVTQPGVVFSRPTTNFHVDWVEGRLRHRRGAPWPPA